MEKDNHRILKAEFAPLYLIPDGQTTNWQMSDTFHTDYRPLANSNDRYWVTEHKLDLSGYTRMDDLTLYFTDSFEQRGGFTAVSWDLPAGGGKNELNSYTASNYEMVLLSTVPLSDANLLTCAISAPGFIPFPINPPNPNIEYGNFDRTHIIHGTMRVWTVDSTFATSFVVKGGAYTVPLQSMNFSSLEPTAADAIYCYRLLMCTNALDDDAAGISLDSITFPPMRVLLGTVVDEEPTLEYMMRLKRSYELANQV